MPLVSGPLAIMGYLYRFTGHCIWIYWWWEILLGYGERMYRTLLWLSNSSLNVIHFKTKFYSKYKWKITTKIARFDLHFIIIHNNFQSMIKLMFSEELIQKDTKEQCVQNITNNILIEFHTARRSVALSSVIENKYLPSASPLISYETLRSSFMWSLFLRLSKC